MKESFLVIYIKKVSAPEPKPDHHKRTKRVSELCTLPGQKNEDDNDEVDPIIEKLTKVGCLEFHYKVQDCYFETKDWRKCVNEVKEFQTCLINAKKKINQEKN